MQYPAANVKARLQSHGQSLEHLQSVAELTGYKACVAKASKLQDSRTAPSAVHFFKVVGHLQRGLALRHLVGEGAKEKRARMHFCLAEAMRCIDREHLRRSTSLATHVDGKGARLTLRFSVASGFRGRKGLLGHVDYHVESIRDPSPEATFSNAVIRIVQNFCTFCAGAPRGSDSDVQGVGVVHAIPVTL